MLRRIVLISCVLSQATCVSPAGHRGPNLSRVMPLGPTREKTNSLAWSPDGKYFASAMSDHAISIWEADSGKVVQTLRGHEPEIRDDGIRRLGHIYCTRWSPDGRYLASASNDQTIRIWDTHNGQQVNLWRGKSEMKVVAWSPDGLRIAVGGADKKVAILDLKDLTPVLEFRGHTQYTAIQAIAWSPDGKKCASGGGDDNIRIWDTTSGNQLAVLIGHGRIPDYLFSRRWPDIASLAWSPDGSRLASSANDWTCRIWDTATYKEVMKLRHAAPVGTTTWSNDGKYIASVSSEPQRQFGRGPWYKAFVRIWNPKDGSLISKFEGGVPSWNPNSKELAVAHEGSIEIWSFGDQNERIR